MTRINFPHTIDSTTLSTYRACSHKAFRQYMEHWKPSAESVHLVAGGAFAKGLEVARSAYFEGVYQRPEVTYTLEGKRKVKWHEERCQDFNSELALAHGTAALIAAYGDFEAPPESAKSLLRTAGALEFYFSAYPLGNDGADPLLLPSGRRAIEFSFAEPLDVRHPVTGDPIIYSGRADMICSFAGGNYIEDDKTTTSLGASWARQWEMRSQFTGYTWAARRNGIEVDGCLIRGVSILKTKYDTLQVITNRAAWEVERWYEQTCRDVERWITEWKRGSYDYSLDGACTEYGGCAFTIACKSPNPEAFLPIYFHKRVWDPLLRKELTVEEYEASWANQTGEE